MCRCDGVRLQWEKGGLRRGKGNWVCERGKVLCLVAAFSVTRGVDGAIGGRWRKRGALFLRPKVWFYGLNNVIEARL